MPVDHDTPAHFVAWLCDAHFLPDIADESGSGWLVSLTVCQVLDDAREEQHVDDLTGVVDYGGPWHHRVADDVLMEHGHWVRVGRWSFDRQSGQSVLPPLLTRWRTTAPSGRSTAHTATGSTADTKRHIARE